MENALSGVATEDSSLHNGVYLVVVTYGDRKSFLEQLVDALPGQGVSRVVIVDNGAQWDVCAWAKRITAIEIDIVSLGANLGSAAGFAAGIEHAIGSGAGLIWLLDDDNRPVKDALQALLRVYHELVQHEEPSRFALLSFRPEHQADIESGVPLERCYPRPGSFLGFHVFDVPYKLWRRTPWGKPKPAVRLPDRIVVPHAPYSGFFFHRSVIASIGVPDVKFVLYGDDTEFTGRVASSGGKIYLVPESRLEDLEMSWNVKTRFGNSFKVWLCGGSELRAFYGARNRAYIDSLQGGARVVYRINRRIYLTVLLLIALRENRLERFYLLRRAISDGEARRLGLRSEYKLP
ncbi:glycosyltransferase [Thioalkalivibrio sulfidiphilus]|uniref:glycosyltransferase n=1 Tax=Thioalkalivibrio sulfidiphilus TaxID=1033854 RepID=UPI003B294978